MSYLKVSSCHATYRLISRERGGSGSRARENALTPAACKGASERESKSRSVPLACAPAGKIRREIFSRLKPDSNSRVSVKNLNHGASRATSRGHFSGHRNTRDREGLSIRRGRGDRVYRDRSRKGERAKEEERKREGKRERDATNTAPDRGGRRFKHSI